MLKFTARFLFTLTIAGVLCCTPSMAMAQNGDPGQSTLNVKSTFLGHWVNNHDPHQYIDIYKEGSFVIVQRGSAVKDGTQRNRFVATYERGNRISVDLGYGLSPLTISDDGSKILFLGIDYSRK